MIIILLVAGAFSFYIYRNVIHKEYSMENIMQILKCDIDTSYIIDNKTVKDNESTTIEMEMELNSELFKQSVFSKKEWHNPNSMNEPLIDFQELIQKYNLNVKSTTVTTYFVNLNHMVQLLLFKSF
jgi:hypothetical protein